MDEELLRDKFAGAILGTMVGDALGAPVEGWDADSLNERLDDLSDMGPAERAAHAEAFGLLTGAPVPPGSARYTDDTQMTLALAESLVEVGTVEEPDLARRFVEHFQPHRGYGAGAYGVLTALQQGAPWWEPAEALFNGQGSYGNGAAMRVAPVGLFYHHSDAAQLREAARRQAIVTHTHPLGTEGAVMQALAVAAATRFDPEHPERGDFDPFIFLLTVESQLRDDLEEYLDACHLLRQLLRDRPTVQDCAGELVCGIEAPRSVPAALYAFLAHYDSFAEAVSFAVRMGNDSDTVGAMCGAISGALLGASAIPPPWLDALENGERGRDYALALADRLFQSWIELAGA